MSRFAGMVRGTILSGGGMIFSMLGGMVVWKVVTQSPVLTEAEVGIFALLLICTDTFVIVNNFGIRTALPKLIAAATGEEKARLTGSALAYQALISLGCGAVFVLAWIAIPRDATPADDDSWRTLLPWLWALAPLGFVATMRELLLAALAGHQAYTRRAVGLAALALLYGGTVAGCVWWLRGGLLLLILATVAAHGLAMVVLYLLLPTGRRLNLHWASFTEGVRFAWPLYLNNLFTIVQAKLDTVIVAALMGTHVAALFEIGAKKLPQYATSILGAALIPFLPGISERIALHDEQGALDLLRLAYSIFAYLGYAAVFAVQLLEVPLILVLFSPEYLEGTNALGLMMAATVMALQAGIMGQTLLALGRPHLITVVNVGLAVISLGLNALLIPLYGMVGAGVASVAAVLFSLVMQMWWVRRSGLALPWEVFLKPQLLFAGCILLVLMPGPAWLGRGLALAAFAGGGFALRIITLSQVRSALFSLRT
ncbi:MAG: oligosaccharide flippase family protein [Candidatus Hydrogenedentes bacterium]|nr:oligosaccharide flippase family protein [Candidatus Hydrogenedentota bacterium]